jgi:hypothetical protein
VFSDSVYRLLKMHGHLDSQAGLDKDAGWRTLAKELGYDSTRRTPAEDAYLDGYYQPKD